MLGSIRKFSKTFMAKIFIAVIALPFILWGMGDIFRSGKQNILAEINDERISSKEFVGYLQKIELTKEQIENFGKSQILENILSNYLSEKIIEIESKEKGIILTDIGLKKIIVADKSFQKENGATIFAYPVKDPERYGVIEINNSKKVLSIEEKPKFPKSNFVITGIYVFDNKVVDIAKTIKPSQRGELEITDILNIYLKEQNLSVNFLERGSAWLDTGNIDSLHEASSYIRTLEHRQGLKVGCPEEIAWNNGWIDNKKLLELSKPLKKSGYGEYLIQLLNQN